jgi:hypothetical protein
MIGENLSMAAPVASSLLWLAVREPELGPNATLNKVLPPSRQRRPSRRTA